MNGKRRLLASLFVVMVVGSMLVGCSQPSAPDTPIIFVNGYLGSGAQYRVQAMRFASNGYPADRVSAFDYDTSTGFAADPIPELDAYVDSIRAKFHAAKVHLVGHSLGTLQLNNYMGDPTRAAKVDKFILVDGMFCPSGASNCLEISEFSLPAVGGGTQTHVEASVSPESFAKQYEFFLGKAPATTNILPEPNPKISGKLLELQANTPVANVPMQLWEINPATGQRVGLPKATGTSAADGGFGPWAVDGTKNYEISANRPGVATFHYYYQPFVRSTSIIRLNSLAVDSGTWTNTPRGPNQVTLVSLRYREFWHSHGAQNDTLTVKVGNCAPINVLQNVTNDVVAVHVHDDGTPGVSSLSLLPYFAAQPFQTGVDVFVPATPSGQTVSIQNVPRGDTSKVQTINVPNWPSSTDFILAEFNDWVQ